MAKDTEIKIRIVGDNKSIDKSLANVDKRLDRTAKAGKKTKKEVNDLGNAFSQTANQVTIFNGQLDPISGRLSAIGTGISRFGVASLAASAGIGVLVLAIGKAITSGDQYEARQLRFNALLRATSYQSRLTARDLEALANQIGKDTLSNTKEAAEGINALLTFKNVQGDVFKDTIRLARDAQVAFGGNLREGVVAFGKALNDPIANLGALSRKGIQFTDVQKEMIHTAWEAGDTLKAQTIIIEEMRSQFGGLANEEAKTLAGSVDSLAHSWDRLWESIGNTQTMGETRGFLSDTFNFLSNINERIADRHTESNKLYLLLGKQRNLENQHNKTLEKQLELRTYLANAEKLKQDKPKSTYAHKMVESAKLALKNQDKIVARAASNLKKNETKIKVITEKGVKDKEDLAARNKKADKIRTQAEKAQLQNRLEQTIKHGNKMIKANDARWETDKEKAKRFYDETIKLNNEQKTKEIHAAKKAGYEITEINDRWKAQNLKATKGYDAKVAEIDRRAADRDKAAMLRTERAAKVAESAERKRLKFINEILVGSNKLLEMKFTYEDDLIKLTEIEASKTDLTAQEIKERTILFDTYRDKLLENYDKDVKKHGEAEASKTAKTIEQAAKRAGASFKGAIDLGFGQIESGAGGFQDFFGINIGESANKFELLESQLATHLEKINQMKDESTGVALSNDEKIARHAAIVAEYGIKQAELEKDGKEKISADSWAAIATLASSGSRKLFEISKAVAMAQALVAIPVAVMESFKNGGGYPWGLIPAGLMAAQGAIQIKQINAQQMPQFHDGISNVPREGSYLLAQGERVVGSQLNADLTADLRRRNNNEGATNTSSATINSYGDASPEAIARAMVRVMAKPNKKLDNAVFGSMNRGRKNGGKQFA